MVGTIINPLYNTNRARTGTATCAISDTGSFSCNGILFAKGISIYSTEGHTNPHQCSLVSRRLMLPALLTG